MKHLSKIIITVLAAAVMYLAYDKYSRANQHAELVDLLAVYLERAKVAEERAEASENNARSAAAEVINYAMTTNKIKEELEELKKKCK